MQDSTFPVVSLGRTAPGDILQVGKFAKKWTNEVGQVKKVRGDTPSRGRGDTRMKSVKVTVMS